MRRFDIIKEEQREKRRRSHIHNKIKDAILRFENEVGDLHDFEALGKEKYIEEWKFTLRMRYDQGEYKDYRECEYHLSLLKEIENS